LVPCRNPPLYGKVQEWLDKNLPKRKEPTSVKPTEKKNNLNIKTSIPQFVSPIAKVEPNKPVKCKTPVCNKVLFIYKDRYQYT